MIDMILLFMLVVPFLILALLWLIISLKKNRAPINRQEIIDDLEKEFGPIYSEESERYQSKGEFD